MPSVLCVYLETSTPWGCYPCHNGHISDELPCLGGEPRQTLDRHQAHAPATMAGCTRAPKRNGINSKCLGIKGAMHYQHTKQTFCRVSALGHRCLKMGTRLPACACTTHTTGSSAVGGGCAKGRPALACGHFCPPNAHHLVRLQLRIPSPPILTSARTSTNLLQTACKSSTSSYAISSARVLFRRKPQTRKNVCKHSNSENSRNAHVHFFWFSEETELIRTDRLTGDRSTV